MHQGKRIASLGKARSPGRPTARPVFQQILNIQLCTASGTLGPGSPAEAERLARVMLSYGCRLGF